jgi:hypothetical protein
MKHNLSSRAARKREAEPLEEQWRTAFLTFIRMHEDSDTAVAHYALDVIKALNIKLRCLPPSSNWKAIRTLVIEHDDDMNILRQLLPRRKRI